MKRAAAVVALALVVAAPRLVTAQPDRERGAAMLGELIRGLGVTARVLVVGAHPDDEDTQLITWLARGRGVETAYLSLTRGDGGQNLIGNELGEALGVVRTEELLAARRIDGGRQYFTRAYDFGFSKSAEETYRHWPKDSILRDVVSVVRAFRPHVIVSVFSGTPRDGHGHHQVAGLLAREAYDVAGDPVRMPVASDPWELAPWTPLKFYRSSRFSPDSATLRFNVGEYNPVLGRSYAEIAGESRSQHKSQGFGALQRRGVIWDYLRREATRVNAQQDARAERSIFDGIDTTLAALKRNITARRWHAAIDSLTRAIAAVQRMDHWTDPSALVESLTRLIRADDHEDRPSFFGRPARAPRSFTPDPVPRELSDALRSIDERAQRALILATGVHVDAAVDRELVPLGDSVRVTLTAYNRGGRAIRAVPPYFPRCRPPPEGGWRGRPPFSNDTVTILPDSARIWTGWLCDGWTGAPHWLVGPESFRGPPRRGDMFARILSRYPENEIDAPSTLPVRFVAGGRAFDYDAPVVRRYADPVRGELTRPVTFAPAITLRLDRGTALARANVTLDLRIQVQVLSAASAARSGNVVIEPPTGLAADSAVRSVTLAPGREATPTFRLRGRLPEGSHRIAVRAESGTERFDIGYTTIDYDHIRPRRMYRAASLDIVAADVSAPAGLSVAYLLGVSDNVAPAIEQLGIPVRIIGATDLASLDPALDHVLVVGPRAYEANDTLMANAGAVLDFARRGGTVVVQYGQHEMTQAGIMPYPIALERRADRVTEEDAPVRVLDAASPILNYPNRITDRDFAGWVQERALYMPRSFDPHYHAPLSMNDPGEPANQGAILVAPVGRGTYVYTTLAFFRQLPAGHPGAARLFVNLLAAGRRPARR